MDDNCRINGDERIMGKENNNNFPQLWAAISHEIRTPLNVIKGMTDISENEIYDVELMRECLGKIKESTIYMQDVVNSLVDYAAIMQNNIEIQNARLDFKTMITEIAMHSYMLAKQKRCHFNMHVKDVSEETLMGDEARISQVLLAMLNIVVRYTASEGIIDFSVQQIGISNAKVFMRFCMRSTALEFPNDIVKYLNDNSLYVNPQLLTPVGTFGITEVNAIYIANLMGGKIRAYNKPGDYSEVIFDMQFDRTDQPYSDEGTKLFAHQRILIAADTMEVCQERGRMLLDMGMQYDAATDVEEILDKIGKAENDGNPFTLCIADREMQNDNCIKLIKEIRKIFGRELIIIVTAHAPDEHIKEIKNIGADYVIDRTIFRSTLFDALIGIEKGIQTYQSELKHDEYDFSGSRVLVAEDVELNMEVITKLLARVNVNVTCVENGFEAVLQYQKKPSGYFGAILLDINMPVMDGYSAAEAIRSSGKDDSKSIPIYAMTANAFKEDVEKAIEKGMNGHIAKPIDVKALYRILNQVLDKKSEDELQELKDLAILDPLTGCLNRRGFENQMNELINSNVPVAYIAIDVDDFKQVNDRFGHEIGDEILKKIVRILKRKFRATDCLVRLGGDEFAIVMIDYKKQSAFLKKRMDEVNEELLYPKDDLPPVTISVGAVISSNGYKQELYTNADKALYQSKRAGKGTCVILDDPDSIVENTEEEEFIYAESLHYMNEKVKVLVNNKQKLRSALMIKNKPVGFISGFLDTSYSVYSFNGFLPELLGYTKNEFCTAAENGFSNMIHPDDIHHFLYNAGLEDIRAEKIRLIGKDGEYLWFNIEYILTKTKDNREFWMASLKYIDDNLIGTLCEEDYRMVAMIDVNQNIIMLEKGAYLASEKELHIQKKYNYQMLIQNAISDTVRENERVSFLEKAALDNVCQKLSVGGVYEFTVYQKWGMSDYNVVRHKYRYLSESKNVILYTWEPLGYRAEIDELTDTYNETGFYRNVEELLKKSDPNEKFDILYFNISDFKAWNSMLGRENADELLKHSSRSILRSGLKPIAASRLFSDHFACLIARENCDLGIIGSICNNEFEIDGNNVLIQMRCGIFHVEDKKESVRSMCDKAKLAKTQITNERALPYHVFDNELNDKYIQYRHVVNQVGHALERREIKVYYQPIISSKTQKVVSAEALIRWILPGGLVMSPAVFVPALEKQGYIADVDSYVQRMVCEMLDRRIKQGQNAVPVSVNVSRMDFLNSEFVGKLKELVRSMEKVKDYICVEVTESSYTDVGKNGENLIKHLRKSGIKILMDDFGTGVSTLSGLTSQQFDIIKIDMSFVQGIGNGIGSEAVIQNVISMCHALNMKVVAEGVETEKQCKFLLNAECDYIQGYYFYKPMSEAEFEKILDTQV